MTDPTLGMPSPTGVRVAGDEYQWLHVWRLCMRMLNERGAGRSTNPGIAVGVEVDGVGNLDDLVYYRATPPSDYSQIKYAVSAATPVNLAYLSERHVLKRMVDTHATLRTAGTSARVLFTTNREIDPNDTLATARDSRDGRLLPRGSEGGPGSALGVARAAWAAAAGVSVDELLIFFKDFHLLTSYDVAQVRNEISLLMTALGLRSDDAAVDAGKDWVSRQVIAGTRRIEPEAAKAAIVELHLELTEPWTTVSIATLSHDPNSEDSMSSLDWIDRFDGDSAFAKVLPKAPHTWDTFASDLSRVVDDLDGERRILVTGTFRQATGFKLGSLLRQVEGYTVAIRQSGQLWSSDLGTVDYVLDESTRAIDGGNDIAIAVAIATGGVANGVESFIRAAGLPVGSLIVLRPTGGQTGPRAVPTADAAISLAIAVRDVARQNAASGRTLHLFLAGPLGFSVLAGHFWNRVMPTIAYEHVMGDEYVRAFQVSA